MALTPRKPCKGTPNGGTGPNNPPPPPPPPVVDEVRLTPAGSVTLELGQAQTISAQAYAKGVAVPDQTYTVSNSAPSIASAVLSGQTVIITPLAIGSTVIKVTVAGVDSLGFSVSIVAGPIATLSVLPTSINLDTGTSGTLTYVAKNAHGVVIASPTGVTGQTADSTRATLSAITGSTATVNALGSLSSSTQVRLVAGSTVSNWVTVNIAGIIVGPPPPVDQVLLSPAGPLTLELGQTSTVSAQAYTSGIPLPGKTYTVATSDPTVATVTIAGQVVTIVPRLLGTANITVTCDGVDSSTLALTIAAGAIATIDLSPTSVTIQTGATGTLFYVAKNAHGVVIASPTGVTGETSDGTKATWGTITTNAGLVNALGSSNATAQVRLASGSVKSNWVTVNIQVTIATGPGNQLIETVDLPVLMNTDRSNTPAAGTTIAVHSIADLQAAMDSAVAGQRILVDNGIMGAVAQLVWNARGGSGWVWIQPANGPYTEHIRMTRTIGDSLGLPKILANVGFGTPVFKAVGRSGVGLRVVGMRFGLDPSVSQMDTLVITGLSAETDLSQMPQNIIFDQCIIEGNTTTPLKRGLAMLSSSTAYIDGSVYEVHMSGFDAEAIWGWQTDGPIKVSNNYLEASSEVVGLGGADPKFSLVPHDIELTRNHLVHPLAWRGVWTNQKNIVEYKVGVRLLIEGNVLENAWIDGQVGDAFVMWSVNQQGTFTAAETAHVTIRKNLIYNVNGGMQLGEGRNYGGDPLGAGLPTGFVPMHHVAISNNVFVDVSDPSLGGGIDGYTISGRIANLSIDHNSLFMNGAGRSYLFFNNATLDNFKFRNNLGGGGAYPLWVSPGPQYANAVGLDPHFEGNVVAGGADLASTFGFPLGSNKYPADLSALGLVGGIGAALNPRATLASVALAAGSIYRAGGTDSTDIGADTGLIETAIAGVVIP